MTYHNTELPKIGETTEHAAPALRRSGERVTAEVPLSPLDTLPPSAQALLARGEDMKGTLVRGIDPDKEGAVTDLAATNGVVHVIDRVILPAS